MNTSTTHRAGWLLAGLTVLPLMQAAADLQPATSPERLEWLLAAHDLRSAIHASVPRHADTRHADAPRADTSDCARDEAGRSR